MIQASESTRSVMSSRSAHVCDYCSWISDIRESNVIHFGSNDIREKLETLTSAGKA
jgi:hypothetical protein